MRADEATRRFPHVGGARSPRADYVREACDGDAALRDQVERLLAADAAEARDGWLDGLVRTALVDSHDAAAAAGRVIGPYRLLGELGRGGMGTVWLAERADDAFRTRVAVKLVRGGFGDLELARRFRAERQIMADLHHPNIARCSTAATRATARRTS